MAKRNFWRDTDAKVAMFKDVPRHWGPGYGTQIVFEAEEQVIQDSSEAPPQTTRSRLIVLSNHPCVPFASVCEAVFEETLHTRMQEDHTELAPPSLDDQT